MRAPSSEQEAREISAELERMPRSREIAEKVDARVEACTTPEERVRWEALQLAIAYELRTGHEISEAQFAEWMELLA